MIPLSERGNELLWRNNRLHSKTTSPKRLRNGCLKLAYRCQDRDCTATITMTETTPGSGEFEEEGTISVAQLDGA